MGTTWADTSQYQGRPIDDSYPHRVFCFRTNSGNAVDTLAVENARRAVDMLKRGVLDAVIPYYFFWPGQANCDLHKDLLTEAGLWLHPRTVSMVDVEGAPKDGVKRVRGNQSPEVNDEVERLRGWYSNPKRVVGYWNPRADPELWPMRPGGLRLVIPQYGRTPGDLGSIVEGIRGEAFAHQYTDTGRCAPWPNGVDLNYSPLELPELLAALGIEGDSAVGVPEDLQLQSRGPELKGWPARRYHETDETQPRFTQTDYLREIDAKENSRLDLTDRPRDPQEKDDQFGHVLSTHALAVENNRLLRALAEKAGLDADAIAKGGK